MKKIYLALIVAFISVSPAKAGVGISAGFGIPYVSQFGLNATMGNNWSFHANYNGLSLDSGLAEVSLTMPEVAVHWHPFAGSFFLGFGLGSQTLEVSATDTVTGATAEANVDATTAIAKIGWMWGKADGGLWFGMDVAFIQPSGATVEVSESTGTLTEADEEWQDVQEAGEQFGETAYVNLTFARLGYLF
jgi:hypothetical protein